MRKSSALVMMTFVALAYQALADNLPTPAEKSDAPASVVAPVPATAPASPASTSQTKPTAPADANKPAADDDAAARARDKRYQAMGYKPVKRDGVTVYCRKEAVVGTRFTRMSCNTAEDLERVAESAKQETDRMVRRGLNQVQSN